MKSVYWGAKDERREERTVEHCTWKDPHEGIWIDVERFRLLFTSLTPFGVADDMNTMATRTFRVSLLDLFVRN